jgi:hypothetical protein
MEDLRTHCTESELGYSKSVGLTQTKTGDSHHLMTWLVYILTNSFFFASTERKKECGDKSYSEMLILARNNGNCRLKEPVGQDDLYNTGEVANFKVCQKTIFRGLGVYLPFKLNIRSDTHYRASFLLAQKRIYFPLPYIFLTLLV